MAHNPVGQLLTGPLGGTLAFPQLTADAHIARSVFGPRSAYHTLASSNDGNLVGLVKALTTHNGFGLDVRAGANITVTRDAQGFIVAGSGGAAASMDEVRAFRPIPVVPEIVAGSNVTVTRNARGYIIASTGGGGSANVGTAVVDFGAFPGTTDASVVVTGQAGIVSGSIVQAWIRPEATADHTADEHMVEAIRVYASDIVAATGFTIHAFVDSEMFSPVRSQRLERVALATGPGRSQQDYDFGGMGVRLYGQWTIAWTWS